MTPLPVRNSQPTEPQVYHPGGHLDTIAVWPTLQGEGPLAGTPAVFVRLAGCNLSAVCKACDTDYTSGRLSRSPDELMEVIQQAAGERIRLCVLTGGEPFRQNLTPLTRRLLRAGFVVQVETNGTLFVPDFPYEDPRAVLVCSPKTPTLHPHASPFFGYLKYIVRAGALCEEDGLPLFSLDSISYPARPSELPPLRLSATICPVRTVYLQPQDDGDPKKNEANVRAAVESCLKFGHSLSLQTHKILGLP